MKDINTMNITKEYAENNMVPFKDFVASKRLLTIKEYENHPLIAQEVYENVTGMVEYLGFIFLEEIEGDKYCLEIDRDIIESDDISMLERELYKWYVSDYFDTQMYFCQWGSWETGVNSYDDKEDFRFIDQGHFSIEMGYDKDDFERIKNLELGKAWISPLGNHRVVRAL